MTDPVQVSFNTGYSLAVMRCFNAAMKADAPKPTLEAILAELDQNKPTKEGK